MLKEFLLTFKSIWVRAPLFFNLILIILFFNSNSNLKHGKRDLFEGGLCVPVLVYWNDNIVAVSTSDYISVFHDFMQTFSDIIQTEKPTKNNGISFLPPILDKIQGKDAFLNWELQQSGLFQIILNGGFRQATLMYKRKAVRYGIVSVIELYDLSTYGSELQEIAADQPAIAQKFNEIVENEIIPSFLKRSQT